MWNYYVHNGKKWKRLANIHITKVQLEGLQEAERNGIFSIFLFLLKTQRKVITKFLFPSEVLLSSNDKKEYGKVAITEILDIGRPLRDLPLLLSMKETDIIQKAIR
ncbi:hypothetical protein [Candidatus Borrarchaeum sp.]|uniref:hypothetical protein n=1 Tax=Candidatus Borrarchaeum sp. TaxID=2846742 RepID=UPI00257C0F48|nr:hypothetical protein [Candidatus Borrarchaeum sp.]